MATHVFISYSSKDRDIAEITCSALEAGGIPVWIAPRNILPGSDYGASIIEALESAKAIILLLSSNSNASPHIKREIERAVNKGIAVIPLRIEEVMPSKSLEYFISTQHWLDAFTPPLERHLEHLVKTLQVLLKQEPSAPEPPPTAAAPPRGGTVATPPPLRPAPPPPYPAPPLPSPKAGANPVLIAVSLVAGLLILVGVAGGLYWWKTRTAGDMAATSPGGGPSAASHPEEAEPASLNRQYLERAKAAGNPEEKIQWLTKALEAKSDQAEVYFRRGLALSELKSYEAAIADYSKTIALDPRFAPAYNNRGNLYQLQGNLDKALEDYQQALTLQPNYPLAYFNRGNVYAKKKLYDLAIKDYNQALALAPNLAELYYNRGLALQAAQELTQALADFEKAISLKPDFPLAFHARGYLFLIQGDYNRALQDLDRAVTLDPRNAKGFFHRAQAYERKGDATRARADFQQARSLDLRLGQ
jgi:tetratricopeptide (TPR) repeat protein